MLLETLSVLLLFASVFAITAGLARDSKFLVPMAGILVLCSGMLLTSGAIEVQEGFYDTSFKNASSTTYELSKPNGANTTTSVNSSVDTFSERTPKYSDLNTQYSLGPLNLSGSLAFIFLAIALYSFILAYQKKY